MYLQNNPLTAAIPASLGSCIGGAIHASGNNLDLAIPLSLAGRVTFRGPLHASHAGHCNGCSPSARNMWTRGTKLAPRLAASGDRPVAISAQGTAHTALEADTTDSRTRRQQLLCGSGYPLSIYFTGMWRAGTTITVWCLDGLARSAEGLVGVKPNTSSIASRVDTRRHCLHEACFNQDCDGTIGRLDEKTRGDSTARAISASTTTTPGYHCSA